MNQPPYPGQPNAISLAAQQPSDPHPAVTETPINNPQLGKNHGSITEKMAVVGGTGISVGAVSSVAEVVKISNEANRTLDQATQKGYREVYQSCREKSVDQYSNKDALYEVSTYNATDESSLDCLKAAGRLEQNTHYTIQNYEVTPFAKTDNEHQVIVLDKQNESPTITKMNASQKNFNRINHESNEVLENLNVDQAASMSGRTKELKSQTTAAAKITEESAVTVANPESSSRAIRTAETKACTAERIVGFAVAEMNYDLKSLSTETEVSNETKGNQITVSQSVTPTENKFTGSPPYASIGNRCFHKELFCSVGASMRPSTSPSYKISDFRVAIILFSCSIAFTGLFFFARGKRLDLEKHLREEAEKSQKLYEIEWKKQKELSNIALVLKESDFLNILHKYKMQTVNLTEAKDLLSTKCGLTDSDILLILKTV